MKLRVLAKHVILAAVLVAGLALTACEGAGGLADTIGGGGQDTAGGGGGGGGSDTLVPLDDSGGGGGTTCDAANPCTAGFVCQEGVCVPETVDGCAGGCPTGQTCQNGECVATVGCADQCAQGFECNTATGNCEPIDVCAGKQCGDDGLGGSCGACVAHEVCNAQFQCECVPECALLVCGVDPYCGESCGTCPQGVDCVNGQCPSPDCPGIADQNCMGKQCGPDGCGNFCGQCAAGQACSADQLCVCAPQCDGKQCGSDGCGGSCGTCGAGKACNASGACEDVASQGGSCTDWFDCANACPPNSDTTQQCMIECDQALSSNGLLTKNAFVSCQTNSCSHCADNQCLNDCVFSECRSEYAACYASAGMGMGTCDEYFGCQNDCPDFQTMPDEFAACDEACMQQSSQGGLQAAYELLFCVSLNCDETNWTQCVSAALSEGGICFGEGEACFGDVQIEWCDPATATCLTCAEMVQCLNGCRGDQECSNNCFLGATEDTYDNEYQPIIDCLVANCPGGDLEGCDQQTLLSEGGLCATVWEACVPTGGGLPDPCTGADCLDCQGMYTCLNGCGANAECQQGCLGQGDAAAQQLLLALDQCMVGACPDGNQTCLAQAAQGACAAQYGACFPAAKSAAPAALPILRVRPRASHAAPPAKLKPYRRLQLSLQVLGK